MLRNPVYILDIKTAKGVKYSAVKLYKIRVTIEISLSDLGSEVSHTLLIDKVNP